MKTIAQKADLFTDQQTVIMRFPHTNLQRVVGQADASAWPTGLLIWLSGRGIAIRLLILLLVAESPLVVFTVGLTLQNNHMMATDAVSRIAAAQSRSLAALAGDLSAANAIAVAVGLLPKALLAQPHDCQRVLSTLVEASEHHVTSIALSDEAGNVICGTGAVPQSFESPRRLNSDLASISGNFAVVQQLPTPLHGLVIVMLPDLADGSGAEQFLWLRTKATWISARSAPSSALPAMPRALTVPAQLRQPAQNGRAFLYTSAPLPATLGGPGDFLLAGSDVRVAATASARMQLLWLAQLGGFFFAEALLIAAGVDLVASKPLRRLNDAVERWRMVRRFADPKLRYEPAEIAMLSRSFADASQSLERRERELQSAIAEQDLLMQEIHHRVKNNLQIIASILNLQAARIKAPEARAEFQSARRRVRALATLHRHLYAEGNLHLIDMGAFFAELCHQLLQALDETEGERISVQIVAPGISISSDQAVPIALFVNETVSNAVKFAFPGGRRGLVRVAFEAEGDHRAKLTVCDDGVGLPSGAEAEMVRGLGLQLVRGFARQLGAELTITADRGTCYSMSMAIQQQRVNTIALSQRLRDEMV